MGCSRYGYRLLHEGAHAMTELERLIKEAEFYLASHPHERRAGSYGLISALLVKAEELQEIYEIGYHP